MSITKNPVFISFDGDLYQISNALDSVYDRMKYHNETFEIENVKELADSINNLQDNLHTQEYLNESCDESYINGVGDGRAEIVDVAEQKLGNAIKNSKTKKDLINAINKVIEELEHL